MVNAFQYRRKACRPERLQITGKFFWRVLFRQQVDELFVPHRQHNHLIIWTPFAELLRRHLNTKEADMTRSSAHLAPRATGRNWF